MAFAIESGSRPHAGTNNQAPYHFPGERIARKIAGSCSLVHSFSIGIDDSRLDIIEPSGSETCLRRQQRWGPYLHPFPTNQRPSPLQYTCYNL